MQMIHQNEDMETLRRVPIYVENADGEPVEGVTPVLTIIRNGGAGHFGGQTWEEIGGGLYSCLLSPNQTAILGHLSIRVADTNPPIVTQVTFVQVVDFDPFSTTAFPETTVRQWGPSAATVGNSTAGVNNSYYAIVSLVIGQPQKWTVVWADQAGPRMEEGGVTGATMSLHDREDGAAKVTDQSMAEVVPGSFMYNASGIQQQIPVGKTYIGTFKALIDGEVRTYREAFKRDA